MIRCYNGPLEIRGFRPENRRLATLLMLALALPACTGVLLGGGSNSGRPLGSDTRTSARVAADDGISRDVRNRLAADAVLRRYALSANTTSGRVILYGTVDRYELRDRAVALARDVEGVTSVDNRIRVVTEGDNF